MTAYTPIDWLLSDDTGISSETILAVMTGAKYTEADIPYDPSDFGRCHRLLEKFPEWRPRMHEVAARYPIWGPMVEAWDELTDLYQKEKPSGRFPQLYARMQELIDAGRLADGWIQQPPGWWTKKRKSKGGK